MNTIKYLSDITNNMHNETKSGQEQITRNLINAIYDLCDGDTLDKIIENYNNEIQEIQNIIGGL